MLNELRNKTGISIVGKDKPIEIVNLKGLEVSLLASGDGTEVIYHKLKERSRWGITPAENWDAMEFFYIIKGKLKLNFQGESILLDESQGGFCSPIKDHVELIAESDTEFIYVSSQPTFHYYSQIISKMKNLAISVEQKDGYTADHCDRITKMAMLVGEQMNLTPNQLYVLNLAAFLHDVGKIDIPEKILNKPGKLTNEEYEIIKTHTTSGKKLLESTGIPILIEVGKIIEQHHERYDGKGYMKLLPEQTDIRAAIITVVDSYDAMTSDRVYRKGMSKKEAIEEIIKCRGSMFNPQVVDSFLSIIDKI